MDALENDVDEERIDARARIVALELLVCELIRRQLLASGDPDAEIDGMRHRAERENIHALTTVPRELVSEYLDRLLDQAQAMLRP